MASRPRSWMKASDKACASHAEVRRKVRQTAPEAEGKIRFALDLKDRYTGWQGFAVHIGLTRRAGDAVVLSGDDL